MIQKQLVVGARALGFSTTDVLGNNVSLHNDACAYTLLVFLRYAGCPWCNLTIHRLTLEYPMLQKQKCRVVAFVQSTSENIKANIYDRHEHRPPFPIIADVQRKYYDLYGVTTSKLATAMSIKDIPYWLQSVYKLGFKQSDVDGDLFLVPAHFLVRSRDNKIVSSTYGSSFYENETFTKIYEPLIFDAT